MQTTLTSQTPAVVYLASLLDCGRAISITRQHVYPVFSVPVKRHRGEPGHTRDTRDTRAHAGTRITRTNLTTNHPNPTTHPHDRATAETATDSTAARTAAGPRSRPLPAYR